MGKKKRKAIIKRDQGRCRHCGATANLTIDHIKPISRGGKNDPTNLQTLCSSCNGLKDNLWPYTPPRELLIFFTCVSWLVQGLSSPVIIANLLTSLNIRPHKAYEC